MGNRRKDDEEGRTEARKTNVSIDRSFIYVFERVSRLIFCSLKLTYL